jgi:flagellar biogenesis protein FliO
MRNHVFLMLFVMGALNFSALSDAQENSNDALLDSSGKLTATDWAPGKASEPVAGTHTPADASGLLGVVLFLLGLGGAGAALVWYVRNRGRVNPKSTAQMAVLERLSLGARRELMLVRAGERLLILASLQNDVKLIASLPNPELPEGIEADLNHLFHERIAEADRPQTNRAGSHACITPSLTIDWPAGPARG